MLLSLWKSLELILVLFSLAKVGRADDRICYYAPGEVADERYVPCGDGDNVSCCLAGDFCYEENACWSPGTAMQYIAGCTDANYLDSTCGAQNCPTKDQFIGIAVCDDSWVCCEGSGQSGVFPGEDYGSCPCDEGYETAIVGIRDISATNSLPEDTSRIDTTTLTTTATIFTTLPDPVVASMITRTLSGTSSTSSESTSSTSDSVAQSVHTVTVTPPPGVILPSGVAVETSQSPPPPPPPTVEKSPEGLTKSAKIAIGVVVPIASLAILAAAISFFLWRRRRSYQSEGSNTGSTFPNTGTTIPTAETPLTEAWTPSVWKGNTSRHSSAATALMARHGHAEGADEKIVVGHG